MAFANKKAEVTALVNENAKLRRSRRKCMALLSAVSLQANSSDVRANLILPAPPGLWNLIPKEFNNERPYIVSKLDFAYHSAATWAMPLISESTNG